MSLGKDPGSRRKVRTPSALCSHNGKRGNSVICMLNRLWSLNKIQPIIQLVISVWYRVIITAFNKVLEPHSVG